MDGDNRERDSSEERARGGDEEAKMASDEPPMPILDRIQQEMDETAALGTQDRPLPIHVDDDHVVLSSQPQSELVPRRRGGGQCGCLTYAFPGFM